MNIVISAGGKFHTFYLASELEKRGFLKQLITSYPKFEAKKYGVPPKKIKSVLVKELCSRSWRKLPSFIKNAYDPDFFISDFYDKLASRKIIPSDIFVGLSSFSLHSMRKAKKFGAMTILERGSSHIVFQNEILQEEYDRYGIEIKPCHPKLIEKELAEYAETDYISVPSLFAKKTFLENGIPERKLIALSWGVDVGQFKQRLKRDVVFRVIFAGGMMLRKGVHHLLQAFSELKLPNAELLLMGSMSEEMRPFFEKYKGKFKWLGHIPQRDMAQYYSQGSVFVLNSIEDGFGMVMLQAMACGLPVIYTTNTGGADIARDGTDGFIIPIRNVETLKEKILYLYENPEICRQMGQSAQKRVAEGFTWADYGKRMITEYERILNSSRRYYD